MNRSKIETAAIFISALSTFALASFAGYGLFLTSIPTAIINSLNEELFDLKAARNEYIATVQPTIVAAITLNMEEDYKSGLAACDQAIELEELDQWIKAGAPVWTINPKKAIAAGISFGSIYDPVPKTFRHDLLDTSAFSCILLRNSPNKKDCVILSPSEFYEKKKKSFTKPNGEMTGIDIINKNGRISQLSLLPQNDRDRLRKFLDDYIAQKTSIYKTKTRPSLARGWTFLQLRKHAKQTKKNIIKMQEDLPALEFALKRFFEQELIIPQ